MEEGVCYFHGVGRVSISWWYRDHEIIAIIRNEYDCDLDDDDLTLKVFFEGTDITDKYIDSMYETTRVRPTISNIGRLCLLIDENMDDYIAKTLEVKEGGDK
jgi:hypothetical protein